MRLSTLSVTAAASIVAQWTKTQAFTLLSPTIISQTRSRQRNTAFSARPLFSIHKNINNNLQEFDYLLQEGGGGDELHQTQSPVVSRRRIALGGGAAGADGRTTVLASSAAGTFAGAPVEEQLEEATTTESAAAGGADATAAAAADDPYSSALDSQLGKIQSYQEQQAKPVGSGLESKLKRMDLQDIIATLILPSIVLFAAGRWVFNRASVKVLDKTDSSLDSFAQELIYHDGDFDEMKLCIDDYSKRLLWLGPKRSETMLKRYLQAYAKKKTVSPQSISSLSYVFTLFKLSEEKAAAILVSLCREMGTDKISSAGKLLFWGSRILKSPEGKEALLPIKTMIMSTYREEAVAETMVETSQQAIAEAAYRTTVLNGGKDQKTLTIGWEVLGIDRATAERIFAEEQKEGFVSAREVMYGGQTSKYDKKGNLLDKEGKVADPENAIPDDDEDDAAVSGVHECSQCGYTLFVAKGRESKFFGENFSCPECGAKKDKFEARDDMDE